MGYAVFYRLTTGYERKVYWANKLDEVLNYAEMVAEHHSSKGTVTVKNDSGKDVATWSGIFINSADQPVNHWMMA